MSTEIICLEKTQIDAASEILAHAFNEESIFRYFAREEQARINTIKLPDKTALRYGQSYNHIYTTTNDLKGIAVWIPPGKFPRYLFMLGISPAYQRQGIGSLLLQPIIKQADKAGLPCYLETSTEGAFASINGWNLKWCERVVTQMNSNFGR